MLGTREPFQFQLAATGWPGSGQGVQGLGTGRACWLSWHELQLMTLGPALRAARAAGPAV